MRDGAELEEVRAGAEDISAWLIDLGNPGGLSRNKGAHGSTE